MSRSSHRTYRVILPTTSLRNPSSKQQQPHAGELLSKEAWSSGPVIEEPFGSPPLSEAETQLPPVEEKELDRLWNGFEAIAQPTVVQMDEFLSRLLSLEPEATAWNDLFHRFSRLNHPDLAGVFRRGRCGLGEIAV